MLTTGKQPSHNHMIPPMQNSLYSIGYTELVTLQPGQAEMCEYIVKCYEMDHITYWYDYLFACFWKTELWIEAELSFKLDFNLDH